MLLEVLQGFALRHIIRIVFQVTKPELAILPVNIPKAFHGVKIPLRPSLGNNIVSALRVENCGLFHFYNPNGVLSQDRAVVICAGYLSV